ncbi:MAG: oxidoreductase [Planctomycetes bacterium]|nr:oxidoreductase [Planctomycetota bacterium]
MTDLHLPWLELAIVFCLIGGLWVGRLRNPHVARNWSLVFSGLALIAATGAWLDFDFLDAVQADDSFHLLHHLAGRELLIIDELSAPLLPLAALLYFLTGLATLHTKVRRFSFAWNLVSEAILLAMFSCTEAWGIIGLLSLGTIPPYLELRERGKPTHVYIIHMALFILLLVVGWTFAEIEGTDRPHTLWVIVPLLGAILVRSGIAPFHCWMTDLFEHASFGTALLFVTPIAGAYAAVRLVMPIAPDWVLHSIGLASLFTSVYAAGMALVQIEARRFFCYLFLSHSALVLVGLEIVTPMALTGALCVWLSVGMALGGFGLTLRALEARRGRLSLTHYHGLYEHTPELAICFVLTGLASVGFPGTVGFVGTELLVDGAVEAYPYIGVAVVVATALNGVALVKTYFLLFTGTSYTSAVSLKIRTRERFAVLLLAALILAGGLYPQPGVLSRHRAVEAMLRDRQRLAPSPIIPSAPHHGEHTH